MAASLTFRREWVLQIKEMLNDADNNSRYNSLPNTAAILRVPTPLLKTNPEAYIPRFISFGLYHHSRLEKDIDSPCAESKIATAEALKGKYAARLSQKLRTCGKSFESVVEMMKQMRPAIESFYHWPTCTEGENSQNFALMMAIDSSFLLQFLIECVWVTMTQPTDDQMVSLCTIYSACIIYDMIKMENQIPLFVLKGIFEYAKEALPLQDFNKLLEIRIFSPFPDLDIVGDEITREPHLLCCVHASHSLLLKMQAGGGEDQAGWIATLQKLNGILEKFAKWIGRFVRVPTPPATLQKLNGILEKLAKWIGRFVRVPTPPVTENGLFPNGISAVELARAGVKFKAFSNRADKIRLDKISRTVYLRRIVVCDVGTEVILRNMLALEFNDALRPKYVTSYVALMGILVQSPEDVRMLVDRHIISRGLTTLTDEGMVKLWNDVRQPFLRVGVTSLHYELCLTLIKWHQQNYWKIKVKRKVSGLFDYMWSWRFIAPLAGFLGLAMTATQTYYSVHHC